VSKDRVRDDRRGKSRPGGNGGRPDKESRDPGSEELLADIAAEAEGRKSEVLARAQQEVEDIRAETDAQIRKLEEEAEGELKRRIVSERERLLGQLRLEERRSFAEAKRGLLNNVFDEAGRRIATGMTSERYRAAFGRLIRQALAEAGEGAVLAVSAFERDLAKGLVVELDLDCRVQADELPAGTVLICSADGLRRVENGLERRLARARSELEEEVARLLWGTTTT
jgi:vacuolar-type H+-ATPase subunit E/Vma4